MRISLWVPGRFSLTNKMLSNLRAAGRYSGKQRPVGWRDLFAEETAAIQLAVVAAAKRVTPAVQMALDSAADKLWNVHVGVFGHHKHDPDSWLLLGKAAVDGLVAARVFSSDRFNLWELSGRTYRSREEERLAMLTVNASARSMGALLTLTDVTP